MTMSGPQPTRLAPGRKRDAPRSFRNPADGNLHIQITQGEVHVSNDPSHVLTTVLGSCVAACIRDPATGIGGMNHFLLAKADGSDRRATDYGVNAMELLINGILKLGGARERLEAKLFGGANVVAVSSAIGSHNASFAEQFLADEGIRLVGGDLRGILARKIQFWPYTGRAMQYTLSGNDRRVFEEEVLVSVRPPSRERDVELF
jgi:chemotaxis protein CheD